MRAQTEEPSIEDQPTGTPGTDPRLNSPAEKPHELGRGRSGFVYLRVDDDGRKVACKVFDSHSLTKLVQITLLGSPNPYIWNEDAVRCALLRRRILADLVEFWFGDKVKVATAFGFSWNGQHDAYELQTAYTPGKPLPLHQPLRTKGEGLMKELTSEVMRPLQKHLIESGFDGLVWQAGKGNPVALNNFLYEREEGGGRWVWIDLESGVPALFPANPLALFGFYLPKAIRLGRPLFDDVDATRLLKYISEHYKELAERLGEHRMPRLRDNAMALGEHQSAWKSLPLHRRSIEYQLARQQISEKQAEHYRGARFRWFGRELVRYTREGFASLARLPAKVKTLFGKVNWSGVPRFFGRLALSHRFRDFVARRFVGLRIRAWRNRGQLTPAEARHLRYRLRREASSAYLSDFGVHLAIKPLVKAVEFWILPMLWGFDLIDSATLVVCMLACGPVVRSFYTLFRTIQAFREGTERPWVALGVGVFPIAGNFAYPVQILYSSTQKDLARFILYDGGARIGSLFPIWGGQDTWTEHYFNRLPDFFANLGRKSLETPTPSG
jgi:hypothetical protein